MFGAIIGDIVGSKYEFDNIKTKDFDLFSDGCFITDDSIMTIAVAKALHESKENNYTDLSEQCVKWMSEIGQRYPNCGYGGNFYYWIMYDPTKKPYNSFGNGSAMRTSECGWIAESLDEAMYLAEVCAAVTHNHPEGIKGAQATTACIYLALHRFNKNDIRRYVNDNFYKLDFTIDEIRPTYKFNVTCQGSVPQAIECFLESTSYEDTIRNCISIGGDCDTTAAIAGAIAEAYYCVPKDLYEKSLEYIPQDLRDIINEIGINRYNIGAIILDDRDWPEYTTELEYQEKLSKIK